MTRPKAAQVELGEKAAALKKKNEAKVRAAALRAMPMLDCGELPAAAPSLPYGQHDNVHAHGARAPPAGEGDLLEGATEIAKFLYGKTGPKERRRVYWLVETGALPVFHIGQIICARRSTLLREFDQLEARSAEVTVNA